MQLNNIVNIVVSEAERGVTQRGFGSIQVLGVHENTAEKIKEYSSSSVLSDLVADGFTSNDPIYRACSSVAAQNPKPPYIKVGKLTTAYTHTFKLTVDPNVETGKIYSFTLISPLGVGIEVSYTAESGDDETDIAAALVSQINTAVDITAANVLGVITCTADNTNEMWVCDYLDPKNLQFEDITETSFTHIFQITVADNVETGRVYAFTLIEPDKTEHEISYTAVLNDTPTLVGDALETLINAVGDLVAVNTTGVLVCTAGTAKEQWGYSDYNPNNLSFENITAAPSPAAELAMLDAIDNDYYSVVLADPESKARITQLTDYIQTQEKIYFARTNDYACGIAISQTDIMKTLNAASYTRTAVIYSGHQSKHAGAGWLGANLPTTPGSITWGHKNIKGIRADDNLTPAFENAIRAKCGNYYKTVSGLARTFEGKTIGGSWIDSIRGRDHFVQRLREGIWQLFATSPKVPYTDGGIAQVVACVKYQVNESGKNGYINLEREIIYNYPTAAEVSAAYKANRVLPGVSVSFYLAGAIQSIDPLTVIIQL